MSPVLEALRVQVENTIGVEASAILALNSSAARFQTALDAALANGATAEQLAPVQGEVDALNSSADNLAAAIAALPSV